MITGRFQVPLFIIFLIQFTAFASSSPSPPNASSTHSNLTLVLQDVLKAISTQQKWDLKELRVLELDFGKVRFGTSQGYEFRIGLGKNNATLTFTDQVSSWNQFRTPKPDLGSLIHRVSSLAQLDALKLEGPFELRVDDLHHLSLSLPMNVSYNGLKHILVGEGITLEVRRAREISLFYLSDLDLQMNGSTVCSTGKKSDFWPFMPLVCMPLIPIRILGSASLIAYRAQNPYAHIETTLISEDTVELVSEKRYQGHMYRKRGCPLDSLRLRLSFLEKILRSLLGHKIHQDQFFGLLKANIKASADVKFPLELERDIGNNVTLSKMPDWRTRPSVERVWFEISARVEENRLKPLLIKKVKPFIESDSISWANLMSNMSYTKLRPVLLPPEALTLDVKW